MPLSMLTARGYNKLYYFLLCYAGPHDVNFMMSARVHVALSICPPMHTKWSLNSVTCVPADSQSFLGCSPL